MKKISTIALAALMLAGTISAVAAPKTTKTAAGFSDGGPAPLCWPGDPGCVPPIPPAAR